MSETAYCFDLDGTLSSTEILPCIAAELGVSEEIATLTQLTMDGMIPFDDSLRLRALILGQVPVKRVQEIVSSVSLNSVLVDFIHERPEQCYVVTGNLDIWIEPVLRSLGCGWFCSKAAMQNGILRINYILDKGEAVRQIKASKKFKRVVAVGDGANDVPMLRDADLSIAYGGVHSPAYGTISAAQLFVNDPEILCSLLKAL